MARGAIGVGGRRTAAAISLLVLATTWAVAAPPADANSNVRFHTALAAFDAQIADLPGAETHKRQIGGLGSGTSIVANLARHRHRLTPAQVRVYRSMTRPAPDALVVGGKPAKPTPRRAPSPQEEIIAGEILENARTVFQRHGYNSAHPIKLTFLDDQNGKASDVLAYVTSADLPPGNSPTCNMFLTRRGRDASLDTRRYTLFHEYAHCAQHAFYSTKSDFLAAPDWVIEGSADWFAGAGIEEMGLPVSGIHWYDWIQHPNKDLFKRSYSAVGFFAMIHQSGVDPWVRIKDVLQAASKGDSAAYSAATAGLPPIFYSRWGPGYVRKPELGPEWDLTGPGIPNSNPTKVQIDNGTKKPGLAEARGAAVAELKIDADVFSVRTDKQTRGLLRGSDGSLKKLVTGSYCAVPGGCKCKTGRKAELPPIGRGTSWVGFGGDPKKERRATFEGFSLKDWCRGKGPKPAPGAGCSSAPSARRQASCPVPPAGIEITDENDQVLATFKSGNCTAGQRFLGVSGDGNWQLEVSISDFGGFDQSYQLTFGDPDPQVVIDGPGGPYGNQSTAPGPAPAGSINMHPNGDLGLGMFAALNANATAAVRALGVMDCVYPDE